MEFLEPRENVNFEVGRVLKKKTTLKQVEYFFCGNDKHLKGVSQRVCQSNGNWSDSQPICRRRSKSDILQIKYILNRLNISTRGEGWAVLSLYHKHNANKLYTYSPINMPLGVAWIYCISENIYI